MKLSDQWIVNNKSDNHIEYRNKNTGKVVTHYSNGRIVANRGVSMEEIFENPEMFIEKGCLKACKALWDLNIFTEQCDGYKKHSSYIETGILSKENLKIFKKLAKENPEMYQITETGQAVIHGKREISEDAVAHFKMQDVYQGVLSKKNIIERYYDGRLEYTQSPDGTLQITIPKDISEKEIYEAVEKAINDGFIYIEKEDMFYQSQFYLDRHLKYLDSLNNNDGIKV